MYTVAYVVGFLLSFVCLSIFPHDIAKTNATRITKRDTEMFHDESWEPIYFRFKRSKVKITSYKNIAAVGLCTVVSAGFF